LKEFDSVREPETMANLFLKQAKQYVATRPVYPPELFDFIASKTPRRDMAWDVGTGNGQAAASVSRSSSRSPLGPSPLPTHRLCIFVL
jgi:hypothetical protein